MLKSFFSAVWRGLKWSAHKLVRVAEISGKTATILFGLLILVLEIGFVVGLVVATQSKVPERSVLVLAPKGPMTEEAARGIRAGALQRLQGDGESGVLLRDWIEALDRAAKDERIDRALLLLDDFEGAGLPVLREAAAAIEAFKASGKPIVAWGTKFDQRRYYLAAHASKVVLHPLGGVLLEGVGRQRNYYKDALDRLGIKANLIRVGQFKSAGEPFVANAPSQEALEAEAHVYDALWRLYTQGIERARKLADGGIDQDIATLPQALLDADGSPARLALDWKLVDELKSFEALREQLITEVGKDKDVATFRQVSLGTYIRDVRRPVRGEHLAVVVAEGEIADGNEPAGRVGGRSTARLIREVAADPDVKAIILRVNSPGGSVLGSELVRDQLAFARAGGKPVVVSMSSLAASGGYWISLSADRIIADPATITGSIGVFGLLPTADGLMAKLSINTGGYRTSWLVDAYDPRRPLDPRVEDMVQSALWNIYTEFLDRTATARNMPPAAVDKVAQGRIWTGAQAKEHGLVDALGGLHDAIVAASRLAKVDDRELPIRYAAPASSPFERVLELFSVEVAAQVGAALRDELPLARFAGGVPGTGAAQSLVAEFGWLAEALTAGQPFAAAAHCLCAPAL